MPKRNSHSTTCLGVRNARSPQTAAAGKEVSHFTTPHVCPSDTRHLRRGLPKGKQDPHFATRLGVRHAAEGNVMKILPANSEGCWLFIFVIFLSFGFCIFLSFLFCGVIFLPFLSFVKSFFVIFLSFFCRFLVVFYFLALFIFLSFSHKDQASGEGGKPGLGNAKKCKK